MLVRKCQEMFRLSHATHRDSEFVGKQRKAVTGELTGTATSAGPVNGAPLGGIHRQKLGQGCGRPALLAPGAARPGCIPWNHGMERIENRNPPPKRNLEGRRVISR